MEIKRNPRRDVAFIHAGAWGDHYVATAALKEVVNENPDAPISIVGSDKWLNILNDPTTWPTVQKILVSNNGWTADEYKRSPRGDWEKTQSRLRLTKVFKTYAATYNLRTESLRYAWAPWLAGVPNRFGSAFFPWTYLYSRLAPWLGKDPVLHERNRLLQVVEGPGRIGELSGKWRSQGLPRLKNPDRARAESLVRAAFGNYWLINPTASRIEKAWPPERFAELVKLLKPYLDAKGIELRVLGAPNETEWLKKVVSDEAEYVKTVVQPETISDLMDVVSGSRFLVTNTSSVQFLAAGFGVKTLTLMGRANPEIWGPLGRDDETMQGAIDPTLSKDIIAQEKKAYESLTVQQVLERCLRALPPA